MLTVKPQEVHISQMTPVLMAENEASFECITSGSRPKAIIFWIFNGQRYNTPLSGMLLFLLLDCNLFFVNLLLTLLIGDHPTSTSITLMLKKSHNNALLTCVAENLKIPGSSISKEMKLDVHCK